MNTTPKQLGLSMPAEWEIHSAVWLAWPFDQTTFPNRMDRVEKSYCKIFKALEKSERVELLVLNDDTKSSVEKKLQDYNIDLKQITFHVVNYADVWTRDFGPTFLNNNDWVKWEYNAYGKSDDPYFTDLLKDNLVFNNLKTPGNKFSPGIVMEGGSIEVNGQGTVMTTEQCLLNPNRNPKLSKNEIEKYLKGYLGVEKIIWLKKGLINDHTDGHIDDVARFVAEDKILCTYEDDISDENYEILKSNFQILKKEPFELITIPMPHMKYGDGTKAPVSYVNFYIANKVVLVPIFNDPNDEKALKIIQNCFPDRKVVGIDASDLIYGGGTIHCMTQQQPNF
jgi:agmatine deiminase